jgi:S1-C subfamily serine protease/mono/diheme cytochrome c family protein
MRSAGRVPFLRSTTGATPLAGVVASVVGALVAVTSAVAAPPPPPQRLTYLLEYIGTDYGAAVRDGAIANTLEYGEVLRFVKELRRGYDAVPGRSAAVVSGLTELETLVVRRAAADEVWAATRRLVPALGASVGGTPRPDRPPNLANGRRLWRADCALCHGIAGGGDGSAAREEMQPPPTAFRGDWLERLTPQQVYHAVSFGVDGTAMPSFADAYSESQRWDVAFYAMTMRVEFAPRRPSAGQVFTLDDLAASSNGELLARLRKTQPDAAPEHVDWVRTNLASAPSAGGALAGTPTGGLALALQLQDVFAGIAERIGPRVVGITGFVRDPTWTTERLQTEHGDAWMAANADAVRYPGFRPVRRGSGLLVDDEGFVVACAHVVRDDAGTPVALAEIELSDDTRAAGALVGAEPMLDFAVLRIAGTPPASPPALDLADSDRVEAGHWVIGLGDPPGPERTFAVGLIASGPQRQCYQAEASATRLQSSLTVSPAALGGPVVDIQGQVVGITVRQDEEPGMPPATSILPINLVLTLLEALKVSRSERSPWIGTSVLELPVLRRRLGPKAAELKIPPTGVQIDDVFDPSPASRAGVRPGDFLVGLGGHPVFAVGDFQTWLYVAGIDATVDLDLVRDGQPLRVSVTVESRPPSATTR